MMAEIEALIDLPTEQPQIAVVSDVEKLNQPFFADAKNGDYVIVYQQAGKVLLYRPATHKVINFANIQIPTSATETFIQPQSCSGYASLKGTAFGLARGCSK